MTSVPLKIEVGGVLREAHAPPDLTPHDVWIDDGRILRIEPAAETSRALFKHDVLSRRDCVALPGFVNAHSHSYAAIVRGSVAGDPLDLFVMEAMARKAFEDPAHGRVAALMHACEMLRNGTTTVVDHFRSGAIPTPGAVACAIDAYRTAGIRAVIAPMFEDLCYLDSLPIEERRLPKEVRARWRAMPEKDPRVYFDALEEMMGTNGDVSFMLGVDGPQRCSPALLEATARFAETHSMGLHTHLLEAKTQALMAESRGGSLVEYLDTFGLVNERCTFAHFVWCNDRDIEIAAARGAHVVHNPSSNLLLGSGIQPTVRLLEAGLNVALGCDSASCNDLSLFTQMRLATLVNRLTVVDPSRWLRGDTVLAMATRNGARTIGLGDELGGLQPGAVADVVLVDVTTPTYAPCGEFVNHLCFYETGSSVHTVLRAGEIVVANGRSTRVDEEALWAEARAVARHDLRVNAESIARTRAERQHFLPLLIEALERPLDIERFAKLV